MLKPIKETFPYKRRKNNNESADQFDNFPKRFNGLQVELLASCFCSRKPTIQDHIYLYEQGDPLFSYTQELLMSTKSNTDIVLKSSSCLIVANVHMK